MQNGDKFFDDFSFVNEFKWLRGIRGIYFAKRRIFSLKRRKTAKI